MKAFSYLRVDSVEDAVRAAQEGGKFVAGGTNLVDLMKYQVEGPDRLIDITHLPLKKIEELKDGTVRIGALVPNSDLADHKTVKQRYPVLSEALLNGASPQLRNMATVGGNLLQRTRCYYFMDTAFACNKRTPGSGCSALQGFTRLHAVVGHSPSCIATHPSDMAVALAALEATINVLGPNGERKIPMSEFHRLPGDHPEIDTTLQAGELITSVDLPPLQMARHSHYLKIRDRAQYAFALVSVAAVMDLRGGKVHDSRIVLGGVAHMPWRAHDVESALRDKPASTDSFKIAAEQALPGAKTFPGNEFKVELAKRSIVRALSTLVGGIA